MATFAEFVDQCGVQGWPTSLASGVALRTLEVTPDTMRLEIGLTPLMELAGGWNYEFADYNLAGSAGIFANYMEVVTDTYLSRFGLASRTTRFLRRTDAKTMRITCTVRYRGRSRLVIDSVAEDTDGHELINAVSEHLPFPEPFPIPLPAAMVQALTDVTTRA